MGARRNRDAQIIRLLNHYGPVEVACFSSHPQSEGERQELISVHFNPQPTAPIHITNFQIDDRLLWDGLKSHYAEQRSLPLEAWLKEQIKPGTLVWVSRLRMAQYIPIIKAYGGIAVLDEHQIESDILLDQAFRSLKSLKYGFRAARTHFYEQRYCSKADLVVTGSEIDRYRLQRLTPRVPVHVLPLGIETNLYESLRKNYFVSSHHELLFFGATDYRPNIEGLEWFAHEVMPRLIAATKNIADFQKRPLRVSFFPLHPKAIIPSRIDLKLKQLGYHVYPASGHLKTALKNASVVFFPLRTGRGNRINVLEALAAGKPIVSTGTGADGLNLKPNYDLFFADNPDSFTTHCLKLLRDEPTRKLISQQAGITADEKFNWKLTQPTMDQLLTTLGLAH